MHNPRAGILIVCTLSLWAALAVQASQDAEKKTEKKSPAKSVEIHLKVSVKGGGTLPPNTKAEISAQEPGCGTLDTTVIIDDQGEAVFKGLPVCKVLITVSVKSYLPSRTKTDLSAYKSPIMIALEPEQ